MVKMFGREMAQVAFEYLLITGFALIVIITIFGYSFFTLVDSARLSTALDSARSLVVAADQVSALGPGNSVVVRVSLPDNVESAQASNHFVHFRLKQLGGLADVVDYSLANITPLALPNGFGQYNVKVEVVDENVVLEVI